MYDALTQIMTIPAQAAKKGGAFDPTFLVMMAAMIAIFYFMLIRPQRQQQKKREEMLNQLKVGDKVLTTSGIYGQITAIGKSSARVRISRDVEVRMTRAGIVGKVTKDDEE